jgi:hypothetical protein
MAMACGPEKAEWDVCLSKSGKMPDKCSAAETALEKCGSAAKINFCIPETRALMKCSLRPSNEQCASEFISMRECNRPGGPKLLVGEKQYSKRSFWSEAYQPLSIAEGKGVQFKEDASFVPPPCVTSAAAMMDFADGFAKKLGIAEGVKGIRF